MEKEKNIKEFTLEESPIKKIEAKSNLNSSEVKNLLNDLALDKYEHVKINLFEQGDKNTNKDNYKNNLETKDEFIKRKRNRIEEDISSLYALIDNIKNKNKIKEREFPQKDLSFLEDITLNNMHYSKLIGYESDIPFVKKLIKDEEKSLEQINKFENIIDKMEKNVKKIKDELNKKNENFIKNKDKIAKRYKEQKLNNDEEIKKAYLDEKFENRASKLKDEISETANKFDQDIKEFLINYTECNLSDVYRENVLSFVSQRRKALNLNSMIEKYNINK